MDIFTILADRLWEAHLECDPESIRWSYDDMSNWCDSAENLSTSNYRHMMMSQALQFDKVVFYAIPNRDTGKLLHVGLRYGLEPQEYMSFVTCNL